MAKQSTRVTAREESTSRLIAKSNLQRDKDVRNESSDVLKADSLSGSCRESTPFRVGLDVPACGRMPVDQSYPTSSYALVTSRGGHPELQLQAGHICRLKVLVLPASSGLQAGPCLVAFLLHPITPTVVVIDIHDMGCVRQREK